ncbi:MAG: T9SS type A sorting domain-containing protein [Bacteroidia bacterium]|nr:T9SS type A sorting domain-containing protein [Bacteroidia bacterium]
MRTVFTPFMLTAFMILPLCYGWGQSVPASGDIVFTQASSDGDDVIEFIILKRLNLSTLGITDNGICSNLRFRANETYYSSGFSTLTDVPAGTYVRITDDGGTNNLFSTDGLLTLYNSGISLSTDGDQVIVYAGSPAGGVSCLSSSGSNTYIAGINIAGTNWIAAPGGASTANNSRVPGTASDYDTGDSDNNRINPATAITGNASAIRTACLSSSNWQGSNDSDDYTDFSLKNIQFNESNYSGGAVIPSPTSSSVVLDLSGLVFSGVNSDTRYFVVMRQSDLAPATPADRYTCYTSAITTNFSTTAFVATGTATGPCSGTTASTHTRVVYFGYGLPSNLTVTNLTANASYQVAVYAVNGNGRSANFSATPATSFFIASTSFPIELLGFRAEAEGNRVMLSWETAQELNNDYIAVERSQGGSFEEVGRVDGAGTTDTYTEYRFTDSGLLPGYYSYRLRQVDFDGTTTLFQSIEVYVQAQAGSWLLFPQPAGEWLQLRNASATEAAVEIRLLDPAGRLLSRQTLSPGTAETRFELSGLSSGVYLVEFREQGRRQVMRFVKQ